MADRLLSVVIGTYNRLEQLKACLESVARETRVGHVVYVTDAGSDDGTVDYLRAQAGDTLRPILVGRRLGQARAYNDVFAQVNTPYVCWLSDDNIVTEGGLDRAVAILERDRRIGMVGLKVKDIKGPFVAAPYIGGISAAGILNVNQGVLPTAVLRAVGGFSEAFRDYGIDPDLTAKVLLSGHDVVYTRAVAILHQRNWETDKSSPEYQRMRERQSAYKRMYQAKFGDILPPSLAHQAKRQGWRALRHLLQPRLRLDAPRPVLGQLPRDWHNIFSGRFISLFDALACRGEAYHLRQHCPARLRPARLPPDPVTDPSPASQSTR